MKQETVEMESKAVKPDYSVFADFGEFQGYEAFWGLQERQEKPHRQKAQQLGISYGMFDRSELPVNPRLKPLQSFKQELDSMLVGSYGIEAEEIIFLLYEDGPKDYTAIIEQINEKLSYCDRQEIVQAMEELISDEIVSMNSKTEECSLNIDTVQKETSEWNATVKKVVSSYYEALECIPFDSEERHFSKQFEAVSITTQFGVSDVKIDISAFNTEDFSRLRGKQEFDRKRYAIRKAEEYVEHLAIMHSCITAEERKELVKQKYISFVKGQCAGYAGYLLQQLHQEKNPEKRMSMAKKVQELNRQIIRFRTIWRANCNLA